MGSRHSEAPTVVGRTSDWKEELGRFFKPFWISRGRPLYVSGLIGPGDRKNNQPMAEPDALGEYNQLATGVWDARPVESDRLVQADRLVGGSDAVLVIDDNARRSGGRRLWAERAVPPAAHGS
jgi:hypothetical protein